MGTTNILDLNNRLEKLEKENVAQNSYTSLKNKPKINGNLLTGDKTGSQLGLAEASEVGNLSALTTTDKSSCVGAINELNSRIAVDNWIPSNGFNPLTECDGWFCYSVNQGQQIYQGTPSGLSEYATVFGCSKSNYEFLVYVDVMGQFAVWSTHDNRWIKYTSAN